MSATPLLLNVFIFQRINGIFFFDLMHCIDHGCKDHKKYAECCNKLLLLYSFTFLLGTIVVTAIVRAASVVTAGMLTFAVLVIVVVALDVRIIAEIVRKIRLDRCIARTADTAVELDARLRKSHLCATADTSADENVSADDRQKSRKCSVSLTVGVDYFRGYDRIILNLINLELLRVTEMLKDLSVFVSNCYFHAFILLIINYISQLPSQLENSI